MQEIEHILFSSVVEVGVKNSEKYLAKQYDITLPPEALRDLRRTLLDIHKRQLAEQESRAREKEAGT